MAENLMADGSTSDRSAATEPQHVNQSQVQNAAASATASVVDLTPDSMIRVPGETSPVKYSEYVARFVPKADFTRAQQAKAAELKTAQDRIAAYERQQQQIQQSAQQQGSNPVAQAMAELANKPYVTGQEAAGIMNALWNNGIVQVAKAIQQRDQVITMLYQRLNQIGGQVGGFNEQQQTQTYQRVLDGARTANSLPDTPETREMLEDIYLSYEPSEELNQQFTEIVKRRLASYRQLSRSLDSQAATQARQRTLGTIKPGGTATPGKPLRTGFKSAQAMADELWPAMQGQNT